VAALRSGKYSRGTSRLKSNNNYCCLGVLCDLYCKSSEGKKNHAKWHNTLDKFISNSITEHAILPPEVQKWAGLNQENPEVTISDKQVGKYDISLSELNDDVCKEKKKGFKYIADIIEKNL
jgi:hypothetical protein